MTSFFDSHCNFEIQDCVLPFWKPPINISKKPYCHGCCSTLNISQAMLKFVSLLVSYYMRLKTNAPGLYVLSFSYKNFILVKVILKK